MGGFYDYPKTYFEKIAISAESNPFGPVSTGPRSNQSCTAELVSYLVSPGICQPCGSFLYTSRNHPYRVADSSLKTCMK